MNCYISGDDYISLSGKISKLEGEQNIVVFDLNFKPITILVRISKSEKSKRSLCTSNSIIPVIKNNSLDITTSNDKYYDLIRYNNIYLIETNNTNVLIPFFPVIWKTRTSYGYFGLV